MKPFTQYVITFETRESPRLGAVTEIPAAKTYKTGMVGYTKKTNGTSLALL